MDVVSLLKSVRSIGVTMVIASHDLDFLTKISDRIVLLKDGKISVDVCPQKIENPIDYFKEYYS
jgi:polar amino acid transport system ATP-binding protein